MRVDGVPKAAMIYIGDVEACDYRALVHQWISASCTFVIQEAMNEYE